MSMPRVRIIGKIESDKDAKGQPVQTVELHGIYARERQRALMDSDPNWVDPDCMGDHGVLMAFRGSQDTMRYALRRFNRTLR